MSRWNRIALLGVAVAIAAVGAVGGTWAARVRSAGESLRMPCNSEAGSLVCDGLELGDIWERESLSAVLQVRNAGKVECELVDLRASCACVSVEPKRLSIPPGAEREIRLELDVTPKGHEDRTRDERSISLPIWGNELSADGSSRERYWVVQGRVKRVFRGSPAAAFDRRSERSQPLPPVVVPLVTSLDLESIRVVESAHFSASVQPMMEHGKWNLSVVPSKELKTGVYEDRIVLEPKLRGGPNVPSFTIPVALRLVDDIEAIPEVIQTGNRLAGTVSITRVELRSLTGSPFVLLEAHALGAGLTILPVEGQERFLDVEHRVQTGASDGSVCFTVKQDTGVTRDVILKVTGYGFMK